jgi:hypothetical protein
VPCCAACMRLFPSMPCRLPCADLTLTWRHMCRWAGLWTLRSW